MNLLVAGGATVDAGKTTFSVGLLDRVDGVGFKPRAGNDYWYDHDDYHAAVEDGRLYGKDAKRLVDASAGDHEPEAINPVHRLWRPAPGGGSGLLGRADREFLVDRVGDDFVVNGRAALPDHAREHLPLADALVVDSLEEANAVMERHHLQAIRGLTEPVRATDPAVVESYGDVALPIRTVEFDAVAVVDPGRARIFDGSRYAKAHQVAVGGPREGYLEETVQNVSNLMDPRATVALPALTSAERDDLAAVADAYGEAYDELLDVARA
ncbi:ATPase [Halobacteriales archaeon QS_1_68_20]|nr:MAG: ATPase [Halobacteriales archaeon QS_1_68_20]